MKALSLPESVHGFLVFAVCLLSWHTVVLSATEEKATSSQSRFERTVASLLGDPTGQGNDFAGIALAKLEEAYTAEARLAREQAGRSGRDAALWGWSVAVAGYARQMSQLCEDIERGSPARLIMGNGTAPAVAVADQVVILNHPRPSHQGIFEQEILQEFCARHSCDANAVEENGPVGEGGPVEKGEPIPVYTGQVRPAWSFMQDGPSCSHGGITVKFKSERNLANSRAICEQLMLELEVLTEELAWQDRQAVAIDWEGMKIEAIGGSPQHMVRLNSAGDVLTVSVPLLYSTPDVLRQVIPWIQRRITGEQAIEIVLEADAYGWQDSQGLPE